MSDVVKGMGKKPGISLKGLELRLLQFERDLSTLSAKKQYSIIADKAADHPESITPIPHGDDNELLQRLEKSKKDKKPLLIKFGIDPTGPEIHLGHVVPILMLRRFQQMGHKIQFVVGDFTAKIGDPSGMMRERPSLTKEDVKKNMSTYFKQAGRILDLSGRANVEIFYNSKWLDNKTMKDWLPLLQRVSASQMFQREDFQKRLSAGGSISMAELMYALYMAYDSVVLKPDIEIGGMDQFLNLRWCRELMKIEGLESEVFVVTDLLAGTSGEVDSEGRFKKMSKSKKNYISINEDPKEVYGKVMSIPDDVMWTWYKELTEISSIELKSLRSGVKNGEIHPMDAKKTLARVIVGNLNYFDKGIITEAENAFDNKFGKSKQIIPNDVQVIKVEAGSRLIDALSQVTKESKSNLKRMTTSSKESGIGILKGEQYRPIKLEELLELKINNKEKVIVKVGKRRYYQITS